MGEKEMEEKLCTLGFVDEEVRRCGGILPLLLKHGVIHIRRISYSVNQQTPRPKEPIVETKFGKIRYVFSKIFDGDNHDINLEDFLNTLASYSIESDRMPRQLEFECPISKHLFDIEKKGKWSARVKAIDGKSVIDFSSEKEIIEIYENSIFKKAGGMFCEIKRTKRQVIDFDCIPLLRR